MTARIRIPAPYVLVLLVVGMAWGTVVPPALARPVTDVGRLEALSQEFTRRWEQRRSSAAYRSLRDSPDPILRGLLASPGIDLMGMDGRGNPLFYITHNATAAVTTRTNEVWPSGGAGYALSGAATPSGVLGIWDESIANSSHQEFGIRVRPGEAGYPTAHPTHVAGTMVAAGVDPLAKGMSYAANLTSYRFDNDTAEMATAAARGMQISNHSYGYAAGWRGLQWMGDMNLGSHEDWRFGFYDSLTAEWDQLACDAPLLLIVKSAGNDRNDADPGLSSHQHYENGQVVDATDYHPPDGHPFGFDTISSTGCAKNILTVGAVEDIPGGYTHPGDVVQTDFSSWGPTDDGRIKPDIVANGDSVYSCGIYPNSNTSYEVRRGTSMAAPNVSGSINLLRELYESTHAGKPRSATLKAVVLHTADEAGPADGPDFSNGWGLLNTREAADVIAAASPDRGHIESVLVDGNTHEYYFVVTEPRDARLTLVWTDPAATPPPYVIDPVAKMLVNDLDVRLEHVPSGTLHLPWRLSGDNPLGVAVRGDNDVDNVERIDAAGLPAGAYRATVTHEGPITFIEQPYTLVWTGLEPTTTPVGVRAGADASQLSLGIPHPNPASGTTIVAYATPTAGPVAIEVFDPGGRRVKSLLRGLQPAGPGSVAFDTRTLPPGVYFLKLETPSAARVRKIAVVR